VKIELSPVGVVESPIEDLAESPRQGDEGAPDAWVVIDPELGEALEGIGAGDELLVLTWLDRADREVLSVHPRGDPGRDRTGVFATRSPHRPNPIGLHRVEVLGVEGNRVKVRDLEAIAGTPVLDLKPVLAEDPRQR
jgi:tRNA-Thr(GGU) m(6)t(6)A37 methyltransferase TsaA